MPNWQIRDPDNVLADTKLHVRMYAIEHQLTIAQAIVQLIQIAISKEKNR